MAFTVEEAHDFPEEIYQTLSKLILSGRVSKIFHFENLHYILGSVERTNFRYLGHDFVICRRLDSPNTYTIFYEDKKQIIQKFHLRVLNTEA